MQDKELISTISFAIQELRPTLKKIKKINDSLDLKKYDMARSITKALFELVSKFKSWEKSGMSKNIKNHYEIEIREELFRIIRLLYKLIECGDYHSIIGEIECMIDKLEDYSLIFKLDET